MNCKRGSCCLNPKSLVIIRNRESIKTQLCRAKIDSWCSSAEDTWVTPGRNLPSASGMTWWQTCEEEVNLCSSLIYWKVFPRLKVLLYLWISWLLWIYIRSLMLFHCIFSGVWCLLGCFDWGYNIYIFLMKVKAVLHWGGHKAVMNTA